MRPNISEGRRPEVINAVAAVVETVKDADCLTSIPEEHQPHSHHVCGSARNGGRGGVSPDQEGKRTHRHVQAQWRTPPHMRPDVSFVPVAGVTMEDCIKVAHEVGERVGKELNILGYFYESAAALSEEPRRVPQRSVRRVGQAEHGRGRTRFWSRGIQRCGPPHWSHRRWRARLPHCLQHQLNTTSSCRANAIAFDIREAGRIKSATVCRSSHPRCAR